MRTRENDDTVMLDHNLSRRVLKKSTLEPLKLAKLKFLIGGSLLFGLLLSSQSINTTIDTLVSIEKSEWMTISILAVFEFAWPCSFFSKDSKELGP